MSSLIRTSRSGARAPDVTRPPEQEDDETTAERAEHRGRDGGAREGAQAEALDGTPHHRVQ